MKSIFIIGVFVLLTGCSFRGFQPPPFEFEQWHAGPLLIQKALLECGALTSWDVTYNIKNEDERLTDNDVVLVEKCMKESGFKSDKEYSHQDIVCRLRPDLDACSPSAIIPKRDINKRLNGPYCAYIRSHPKDYVIREYPSCLP